MLINRHTEEQNKNKSKKSFVEVTEKYLKIEEYLNIYDGKLFERNECLESSGILLRMDFVSCEMNMYP